jgi:DNA-directed RNA polymerase specialized sigma24 family protein
MSSPGSVTDWLAGLSQGDQEAIRQLWQRYFPRLVGLARQRLRGSPARQGEAEDVALSAFDSFCRGAEQGRFPDLFDRDDLWRLLVVITARKAANLLKRERRQKRGGGVVTFSDLPEDPGGSGPPFADLLGREPDPQFAAQAAEEARRLLAALGDPVLQSVAVWKMEGRTNEEVAALLGRSLPTVERKLRLIRALWEGEGEP